MLAGVYAVEEALRIIDGYQRPDRPAVEVPPLDRDDASLTAMCEQAIRNHDPCISCSAHFLTLTVQRR